MDYVITKTIAVQAETPEEAVAKINEGNTIALNVAPRPSPVQAGRPSGLPAVPTNMRTGLPIQS